jgi:hypothetical protein
MLKNKKHPDGVELMSSDDLKPDLGHDLGHKVSVAAMMHGGVWIQSHKHEHGVRAMRRA